MCETWIKTVYIRGIWCHTHLCLKTLHSTNHEWNFRSEVNYNGFPLLREKGAMDTVYMEHINQNSSCTEHISNELIIWIRCVNKDRHANACTTGIENRWCKSCHAQIKYAGGNTTNLRNHISRFHSVPLTLSVPSIYLCICSKCSCCLLCPDLVLFDVWYI